MKVLIVNTSEIQGGAARAAYRLHKGLLKIGIDSQMLVQSKNSDDYTILGPDSKLQKVMAKFRPIFDFLPLMLYKNRSKTLFSPAWLPFSGIITKINEINPDIVHLHWIAGGMVRIEDLAKIGKPIVWSLHDNWSFTGGCHLIYDCQKYKVCCEACPNLSSTRKTDLSRWVFKRKQKTYKKIKNLTIVGLSRYMVERARDSVLFKDKKVIHIPNNIDSEIFKPLDKKISREILNLPFYKKLILFVGATGDANKGFKELTETLQKIKLNDIELVILGSSQPEYTNQFKFSARYFGHIYDDISLRILYSAADMTIVPSLQENLPNTIMESLSCGTPVVAFDVGGNKDMVEHKIDGYLAQPFDVDDLAKGIEWVIEDSGRWKVLSYEGREKVKKEFDSEIVAQRYANLYGELLSWKNYSF